VDGVGDVTPPPPPNDSKFSLFFPLEGRKIKVQQISTNSFTENTELKEDFLEQAIN